MTGEPRRNEAWSGMGRGWGVASTLLAAILVCGGLGYLIDRLIGRGRVFLAIGMLAGVAVGTFLIYRTYGEGDGGGRA